MTINPIHQFFIAIPLVELGLGYDSTYPLKAPMAPAV